MNKILLVLTALSFLFVLFTLIMGGLALAGKEGEARSQASNKWMQRRVAGQAVAIILLFATFATKS